MSFPLRSGRWTPRRAAGQLATLLALALLPATAFAYLDYFGFSTAPAALLPDECFSTYAANLSLVWPEDADPDAPSPLPGLSNAQRMAQDVLLRGAQGIKSVLHLGFVIDTRSDGALRRRYVIRWGRVFRQLHADRFVYAVIGIDDSNCSIFSAAQERAAILHRRRMTALVKYAFPAVKLRGNVLNVGGWGAPIMGSACAPLPPSDFGLRNETVVFAYDYLTDGTTACAQLGNPLPTEADANASMILADLAGMIDTLSQTETGAASRHLLPEGLRRRHLHGGAGQRHDDRMPDGRRLGTPAGRADDRPAPEHRRGAAVRVERHRRAFLLEGHRKLAAAPRHHGVDRGPSLSLCPCGGGARLRAALDAAGRRRPGARGPAPAAHGVMWLPLVPGKWAQAFSNRTDSLASRSSTGEVGKTGTIGT